MRQSRIARTAFVMIWTLAMPPPPLAASVPDSWSGVITLDWSSQLPQDSPLRAAADRVIVDAHTEWTMRVHFKRVSAKGRKVEYRSRSANIDYLQTYTQDSLTQRPEGSFHTRHTERREASGRPLDGRACRLVFWVDYDARKYWIEVGGFEIEDAERSGNVLIEISDSQGTRRVNEPITGTGDVIEPVRFEGRYTGSDPQLLEGTYDANVEPPPGVDYSFETVGGQVDWRLFRGACPDVEDACIDDAERTLWACAAIAQGAHELDCDLEEMEDECFDLEIVSLIDGQPMPGQVSTRDCLDVACKFVEGHPVSDSAFELGIDAMMECWDQYWKRWSDCTDLCP